MARKTKTQEEDKKILTHTETKNEVETPKEEVASKVEIVKVDVRGNIREFSLKIHGENFVDLAKQFAENNGGKLV